MDIEIRPIAEDEAQQFYEAIVRGFGGDAPDDGHDRFYTNLPLSRTVAAIDGGTIVGTLGEFDFDLTVPGGSTVAMAGTTVVTVRPTHRRQGILREMMRLHLQTVADRGDPLAGLWSSEAAIYPRFGFGLAADRHEIDIDSRRLELPPGPDDIRIDIIDGDEASRVIPDVYERVRTFRAGMLSRSEPWWEHRRFYDPERNRGGASARRYAVARRNGGAIGYVMYRQKEKWDDFVADGTVNVIEIVTDDDGARRALWHFLANIDLFPNINWWNAAVDEPVVWEASDRRQVRRRISDTLWLRIFDVTAALEARAYESDGRVVMGIRDEFGGYCAGTYAVDVAGGVAAVTKSDEEPRLVMDVAELGALYLGGRSAHELWSAGRIEGDRASILAADRLFRTVVPPWCPEVF